MMYDDSELIKEIINRLENVDDEVLKSLVYKLIDERNNLNDKTKIDPLTGIYNRRIIENIKNFSVIVMCDIDNFKDINDRFGHNVGDEIIKGVASILKNSIRDSDYVCRFGGDEFFISFYGCDLETVKKRMNYILYDISNSLTIPNKIVTISAGLSVKEDGQNIEDIIKEADDALYESKRNGKNFVSVFDKNRKEEKIYKLSK